MKCCIFVTFSYLLINFLDIMGEKNQIMNLISRIKPNCELGESFHALCKWFSQTATQTFFNFELPNFKLITDVCFSFSVLV